MGNFGGAFLRFGGVGFRVLQLCCAGIILGVFSYFLSILKDHNLPIYARWKAVEGISGAAVVYTIFGIILTLCLGGNAFFGFLAVVLDILFIGGFVVVCWYTRHSANSCTGVVDTPLGTGDAEGQSQGYGGNFGFGKGDYSTYFPRLRYACKLTTTSFSCSVILCFLFAFTAIWQVLMIRHHKKQKAFGPSPTNNYTSGSGRRPFWKRGKKVHHTTKDAEAATAMGGVRHSHETETTLGNGAGYAEPKYGQPGYRQSGHGHF